MISTDLTINSGDLNHRNCAGYYFARWFDEPFAVAVLNLLDTNSRYALADDAQDFLTVREQDNGFPIAPALFGHSHTSWQSIITKHKRRP